MTRLRFSAGTPGRVIELRLRDWGLEEYFVDGRLLRRRFSLWRRYRRELRVEDSDVVLEAARHGRSQILRAVVDGGRWPNKSSNYVRLIRRGASGSSLLPA